MRGLKSSRSGCRQVSSSCSQRSSPVSFTFFNLLNIECWKNTTSNTTTLIRAKKRKRTCRMLLLKACKSGTLELVVCFFIKKVHGYQKLLQVRWFFSQRVKILFFIAYDVYCLIRACGMQISYKFNVFPSKNLSQLLENFNFFLSEIPSFLSFYLHNTSKQIVGFKRKITLLNLPS